jgi:hypothetical protein
MTMSERELRPYWVDCVHGKHECWSYADAGIVNATVNGRNVEIVVPDDLANVRVLVTADAGEMLFCFGRTEEQFINRFCGLVLVAKRVTEARYEVGVWHELYPWALKHFGYESEMGLGKDQK